MGAEIYKYNVIIVGAGPAGLSAALNLKRLGVDNLIVIERFKFPRYKCCAGYITGKTKKVYENLGLNIKECHYSLIKDFNILYKHNYRLNILNKFLYTNEKIDRVELDNSLFELAVQNGISVKENTSILSHNAKENEIILSDGAKFKYVHLIFADGTTGFGSKAQKQKARNIAMQLTFHAEMAEKIDIHFGITKRGYGWVSSYNGMCNVGLTDVYRKKVNYKEVFSDFLNKLEIQTDISGLKAAFTPIGTLKPVLNKNIYYVGDAVGACDPLTLSGLRYALNSGEKCAQAIYKQKAKIYKKYIRNLKVKFGFMNFFQKIFYLKATLFITFNVLCRFFGKIVSCVFNNFFVNKK